MVTVCVCSKITSINEIKEHDGGGYPLASKAILCLEENEQIYKELKETLLDSPRLRKNFLILYMPGFLNIRLFTSVYGITNQTE